MRAAAAVAIGVGFLALLWGTITSSPPETDLWWYTPTLLHQVEGKSAWALLVYILQPSNPVSQPSLKLLTWAIHGWLHWPFSSMILICVLFHMANAGLLFWVGRRLGLCRRSAALSAVLFLTMFVHFHAYLWPTAAQHVFSVFGVLGTLGLYLKTEEKMGQRLALAEAPPLAPARREGGGPAFYGLTGLAAVLASTQRATLVLLPFIVADLWLTSSSPEERRIRYDRWMPLFLLFPIYNIVDLALVGGRITSTALAESGVPAGLKVGLLLAGVAACVAMGRSLVRARWAGPLLGAAALVGFLFLFPLRDKRQILFAYNALVPFSTVLGSFLDPFRAALGINGMTQYYLVPAQVSGFLLLLTLFLCVLFWILVVRLQRRTAILFVWYAASLSYIFLHRHAASSFPVQIYSRYYIYFTPVVAWVVSSVLIALFDLLPRSSRSRRTWQGLSLCGLVGTFCLANVVAIRVAVFRGRFYNTYGIYDDIRVAHLVRDDVVRWRAQAPSEVNRGVYVDRMVPLDFRGDELPRVVGPQGVAYDNFRMLALDALRGLRVEGLRINTPPPYPEGARVYRIAGPRLEDGQGRPVDLFLASLENRSFEQAAAIRPFLLRYLLGSCRLEDARWITGGAGLREWLEEVIARYQAEQSVAMLKQGQAAAVVRTELLDYGFCLLYLAHAKHREGSQRESRDWLLQLRILEPDPDFLVEWLSRDPRILGEPGLAKFLQRLRDPVGFQGSASGETRGEFGPFLRRLLIHG